MSDERNPARRSSKDQAAAELAIYKELKRKVCQEAGGPEDCLPILSVMFADGNMGMAGLGAGHPVDQIELAVSMIRRELEAEHGPVAHVTLVNEGYYKVMPGSASLANYRRGDTTREFKENPASDVREALIVSVVSPSSGTTALATTTYIYDDHGQPVFDEDHVQQSWIGGPLSGGAVQQEMERVAR